MDNDELMSLGLLAVGGYFAYQIWIAFAGPSIAKSLNVGANYAGTGVSPLEDLPLFSSEPSQGTSNLITDIFGFGSPKMSISDLASYSGGTNNDPNLVQGVLTPPVLTNTNALIAIMGGG